MIGGYPLIDTDCSSTPTFLSTAVYAVNENDANDACEKIEKGVVTFGPFAPGQDMDADGYTGLTNIWECFTKDTP